MILPKTSLLLALSLLFAAVQASAEDQGEVRVDSIEAASGSTLGSLVGLLIDHDTPDLPVAAPGFSLDGSDVEVLASHVQFMASPASTSTATTTRPIHEGGPAAIEGVESRPNLHFWITPTGDGATIEVQHRACTTHDQPVNAEETRRPALDGASTKLTVDAHGTAQVASCTDALATIHGDFAITAWEWDMTINGDRTNSGVNDTARNAGLPAAGVGSADELHIQARDATLTIPLTAKTYELFIAHPNLDARELRLTNVEGTLPGVLERLEGVDVELVGDYLVTIDATTHPFTATVAGTTSEARSDGATLSVKVPTGSGSSGDSAAKLWIGLAILGMAGMALAGRPLLVYHYSPGDKSDLAPRTLRQRVSIGLALMAEADAERGKTRRAMRRAQWSRLYYFQNPNAAFVLAGAHDARGEHDEALTEYQRAHALASTSKLRAFALVGEAEVLDHQGDPSAAGQKLLEARATDAEWTAKATDTEAWNHFERPGILALVRSGLPAGSNADYHA